MRVLIFSRILSGTFIILRETGRDKIEMHSSLRVKYMLFLSDINENCMLSTDAKKIQISNLMKIRSVGAELFHADRRTDRQT
jgi:hypothetical protein